MDFNCKKEASHFDLYYLKFTYQLEEGAELADMIYVRDNNTNPILGDVNDDPVTERGTVTTPATPPPPQQCQKNNFEKRLFFSLGIYILFWNK